MRARLASAVPSPICREIVGSALFELLLLRRLPGTRPFSGGSVPQNTDGRRLVANAATVSDAAIKGGSPMSLVKSARFYRGCGGPKKRHPGSISPKRECRGACLVSSVVSGDEIVPVTASHSWRTRVAPHDGDEASRRPTKSRLRSSGALGQVRPFVLNSG